ncbi:hypothetical protein JG688_00000789 [Phytophthora aleatoria]|uniref:Uncharacterized protein n=1 Tax=Phytophthora aleatoria TaxID=2496075 RepID=A0A8J5JDX6_9STRA|nr:hypothetical protein JG688_00000789 [Phytophthora aleatoria]
MIDQLQLQSDGHESALSVAMFEVQIVRQRKAGGGLQALRRPFSLAVSGQCLTVTAGSSTSAVLNISHIRIKSVRVRGRLLRVVVDSGDALTVRLRDQEEVLRAAEAMMETWGVDPLVEDSEVLAAESEEIGVEGLVNYYVNDPNFRQVVHEIHDHIDAALSSEKLSYEGYEARAGR